MYEQVFARLMTQSTSRSCPYAVLDGQLQQLDWFCCSNSNAHWNTDDTTVAVVHCLICMDKPDTSNGSGGVCVHPHSSYCVCVAT